MPQLVAHLFLQRPLKRQKLNNNTSWFSNPRGCSQTTFTRGRQVVQKCPLFVNIHTIENVNGGGSGRWSKKAKIVSTQFVNNLQCFSNPILQQPNALAAQYFSNDFFYWWTGQYAIVHVSVSSTSQLIASPKWFKIELQTSLCSLLYGI